MSTTKFEVGDLIKGLSASDTKYLWTTSKMHLARVIEVFDSYDEMRIEIIKHERARVIGGRYTVANDSTLFGLVEETCDSKVVIYCKGKDVIAKNTKTGETAKATCHPHDPFDFNIGAKLAFARLMTPKEEEPKLYNGKVVCVDNTANTTALTVGKIYEFVDGKFKDNEGTLRPFLTSVHNLDEFHKCGCLAKFIEVVE